jgi:uncharacterized protein YoaH (UPF0181 family)
MSNEERIENLFANGMITGEDAQTLAFLRGVTVPFGEL